MSQAKDRPFPCSMYKENFGKKLKILGSNNCSLRRPPCRGSPQGAGGQPKAGLHRLPPLPLADVAVTTVTVPVLP